MAALASTTLTLGELADKLGVRIVGDSQSEINGLAPLDSALPNQLAFLANPKYLPQVAQTAACAVIVNDATYASLDEDVRSKRSWLIAANPYAVFARAGLIFAEAALPPLAPGVAASAYVDPGAQVAASASIGPFAVIEAGAVIGDQARIDAYAFVGRGSRVGAGTHLYPRVTLYHECRLGARVIVHSGAVIGADGFGFAPDFDADGGGEWVKIVQFGAVDIGDDVEIGANTTIDRGALDDTVIERGVKIDNLVQIGHNCRIGEYTVIAGCTGIAGSTVIGRHCMIGGAVGIAGHVTLADRVIVTGKSGVSKSLKRAGIYTSAFPAVDHADWNRNAALMRNLDKMRERIKQLESAVAALNAAGSSTHD